MNWYLAKISTIFALYLGVKDPLKGDYLARLLIICMRIIIYHYLVNDNLA